ncbi:MAG TPA: DNA polymerase III subunit delta' [Xanthobacteraceae bacterium]|jgi:DNA polymerase-3 subunit delta'
MSLEDDDENLEPPHPRAMQALFGHGDAERALLDGYRGGRIPHAWLIGGPAGIGKATLAYRLARFVLAYPDPSAPPVQAAASLAVPADNPVARQIAAQGRGDLLALERTEGETGKLRTVITVDQVRRTVSFFGSTASAGGWRVCIVDSADELQYPQAANALLKVLEEPPPQALLLLVSHAPARLLPTIRSRCRRLGLRALAEEDVISGAAQALCRDPSDARLRQIAALAEGSIGRAVMLSSGPALALRKRTSELLERLPALDPHALHAIGDAIGGTEPQKLENFIDAVNVWLADRLEDPRRTVDERFRLAEAWDRINIAARDADIYNLERKPLVFRVFGWLAEAAHR